MTQKLVSYDDQSAGPRPSVSRTAETELDALLDVMRRRGEKSSEGDAAPESPLQRLRESLVNDLIPVFVELVEKYSKAGVSMQMDASNFLEGGREIRFEFSLNNHRTELHGTVTNEGIAFHEVRYSPDFHGELAAGPMLRLRGLNARTFREFVCERLALLIRGAIRRR
jgi:hypothetical protein